MLCSYSYVMFDRAPLRAPGKDSSRENFAGTVLAPADSMKRCVDLYVPGKSRDQQSLDWRGRFTEIGSTSVPEAKDKHFFLVTRSTVLHGELQHKQSLKKVPNVRLRLVRSLS